MAWTPPSKFMVFLTFLIMVFGAFIALDQSIVLWSPPLLPTIHITPTLSSFQSWMVIEVIVVFLTWFLLFLAVKLRGL